MTRSLTKNQRARRGAILDRLRGRHIETAGQLRSYLGHYHRIFVTLDTVRQDLRAMQHVNSVCVSRGYPTNSLLWEAV